jgi:hypothetical protein
MNILFYLVVGFVLLLNITILFNCKSLSYDVPKLINVIQASEGNERRVVDIDKVGLVKPRLTAMLVGVSVLESLVCLIGLATFNWFVFATDLIISTLFTIIIRVQKIDRVKLTGNILYYICSTGISIVLLSFVIINQFWLHFDTWVWVKNLFS